MYCNWINFYNPDVIDRPAARDTVASKMMWMRNVKYAVSINLCLSLYHYWVVLALSQWTDLTQLRCGIFPPFVLHFLNWCRYLINIRIAFYSSYVHLGWTEKRTQDRRSIQLLVQFVFSKRWQSIIVFKVYYILLYLYISYILYI